MKWLSLLLLPLILISCKGDFETVKIAAKDHHEEFQRDRKTLEREGFYKKFDDAGTLIEEANYRLGKLDGERKLFYETGQVHIIENYKGGVFDGLYQSFYPNGQPKTEESYINNTLQGEFKLYYPSGKLKEVVQFKDNEENGPFVEYHENGQIMFKGNYLNGDNEEGLLEQFNDQGQLIKKMECQGGRCNTVWTSDEIDKN